jgi:5-methylcytosine-specific restriction endonuclease McrA
MVPPGIPAATKRLLLARDGFHCRFCGIPLVPGHVREKLRAAYPEALRWGSRNREKHAALQAMEINFDHVLPRSKGGSRQPDNLVIACAPCNCGRSELTLAQAGLLDPRLREPLQSDWNGLERLLSIWGDTGVENAFSCWTTRTRSPGPAFPHLLPPPTPKMGCSGLFHGVSGPCSTPFNPLNFNQIRRQGNPSKLIMSPLL